MIYYNPQTKDTKTKEELKRELHCSLSATNPEKSSGYYLVEEGDLPEYNNHTQRVVTDKIVKKSGKYVQTYKVENIPEEEILQNKLSTIHAECDAKLSATDYFFNSDYDGTGNDNEQFMSAIKNARSTWRRLRQTDVLTNEEIPEIPKYKDFA